MILNRGVQEPKIKIEITLCRDWTEPNASQKEKKKKKQGIVIDSITFAVNIILFNYIPK